MHKIKKISTKTILIDFFLTLFFLICAIHWIIEIIKSYEKWSYLLLIRLIILLIVEILLFVESIHILKHKLKIRKNRLKKDKKLKKRKLKKGKRNKKNLKKQN